MCDDLVAEGVAALAARGNKRSPLGAGAIAPAAFAERRRAANAERDAAKAAKAEAKAKAKIMKAVAKAEAQAKAKGKARDKETQGSRKAMVEREAGSMAVLKRKHCNERPFVAQKHMEELGTGVKKTAPRSKRRHQETQEHGLMCNQCDDAALVSKMDTGVNFDFLALSAIAKDKAGFISAETGFRKNAVAGAIRLFAEGNTLPFIARYRKEITGSMDENQLRRVERSLKRVETLEARRRSITGTLWRLGKLGECRDHLLAATTLEELEDLYEPYKTQRRTRAQAALERGLGPLADLIDKVGGPEAWKRTPQEVAADFLTAEVATVAVAMNGARDIVAERHGRSAAMKASARELLAAGAAIRSKRKGDGDSEGQYRHYWDFQVPLHAIRPHQFLALQRAERGKALLVGFICDAAAEERLISSRLGAWRGDQRWLQERLAAIQDGFRRLLKPSLEREWRRVLQDRAADEAFDTYRRNLSAKLLTPPIFEQVSAGAVIGLDPGYRNGCKIAAVDATGQLLETTTIYNLHSQKQQQKDAERDFARLLERVDPVVLAIGNGTGSAETEIFVRSVMKLQRSRASYLIADEAGASIYSASPIATAELPQLDVALRGAVSIARRVIDPLAELVKIDPQSIGVGLYQHDLDHKRLVAELQGVVEECVNCVGVDLNTASQSLLAYVAGLGPKLSRAVVAHRDSHGAFASREALRDVKGLGPKAFEQAAGFLRIRQAAEPLDATAIHPESYPLARELKRRFGERLERWSDVHSAALIEEFHCGTATLADIVGQLRGDDPTSDPRAQQPKPLLKLVCDESGDADLTPRGAGDLYADGGVDAMELGLSVEDLLPGMRLRGVIRNVVAFGSFIDVGVHEDGLLHISEYPAPVPRSGWPMVNDRAVFTIKSLPERRGKRWRLSLSMRMKSGTPVDKCIATNIVECRPWASGGC